MKIVTHLVLALMLAGCGTMNTLTHSDQELAQQLKKQKTYCESSTRVYSGVSFNICKLHSNPNKTYIDWNLGFYIVDTAASAVTDTLALPYTIYQQSLSGNLVIGS